MNSEFEQSTHLAAATVNLGTPLAAALWSDLSVAESIRNSWWDSKLRLDEAKNDPTTKVNALREWTIAEKLIDRLAFHMGWPKSFYMGFVCLEGLVPSDDATSVLIQRAGIETEPAIGHSVAIERLAATLLECRPIPANWLLLSIAKDESLPAEEVLTILGQALSRSGRHLEASRVFDAVLLARYYLLRDLRSVRDEQISVVEDYRGNKVVFDRGRFYAFDISAAETFTEPSKGFDLHAKRIIENMFFTFLSDGLHRSLMNSVHLAGVHRKSQQIVGRLLREWHRYRFYSADRFQKVIDMIDTDIRSSRAGIS